MAFLQAVFSILAASRFSGLCRISYTYLHLHVSNEHVALKELPCLPSTTAC